MIHLDAQTISYMSAVQGGLWPADPSRCPQHFVESLERYVRDGIPTGSFLEAVLANDLFDAFRRADQDTLVMMPTIIAYIYSHIPTGAHGSRATIRDWISHHPEVVKRRTQALVDNVNSKA